MCKHLCNCAYCVGDNMDEKSFSNLWLQVVVNRNQLTLSSRCIYSFQVYFPHFSGIQQTLLLWNIFPVLNPESKILCIPSIFPNTHRGKFHSPPQNKQTKNFCSNLLPLSVFFLISDSIWKDIGEKKFCQHLKHGSPGKDIYISVSSVFRNNCSQTEVREQGMHKQFATVFHNISFYRVKHL